MKKNLWSRIKTWFTLRRECCWCEKPHWIGGNPFASVITSGMCERGYKRFLDSELRPLTGGHTKPAAALKASGATTARAGAPGFQPSLARKAAFLLVCASLLQSLAAVGREVALFEDPRFSALSMVETGNNDYIIGVAGEVSRFQIKVSVWREYCALDPRAAGINPFTALNVATAIMQQRCAAFAARFHQQPDDFQWYVLWNRPAVFLSPVIRHLSPVERDRAERFVNLLHRRP